MVGRLGDRVRDWCLFNEPKAFTQAGYLGGVHAPGLRDMGGFLRAVHVVNLAYGRASRAMRAARQG